MPIINVIAVGTTEINHLSHNRYEIAFTTGNMPF